MVNSSKVPLIWLHSYTYVWKQFAQWRLLLVLRHHIHRVLGAIVLGIVVATRVQEKLHGVFEPACARRKRWRHPPGRAALQICAGLHQMLDEVDALVPSIPRRAEKAQSRVPVRHTPL